MTERQLKFISAVLGPSGAEALNKAAGRSPVLGQAILPRCILSWIKNIGGYNGELPGLGVGVILNKSEGGYNGNIGERKLNDASLFKVCAATTLAIGVEEEYDVDLVKSLDVEKLGKSIDLLIKAKILKEKLEKKEKKDEFREKINVQSERSKKDIKINGSTEEESDEAGSKKVDKALEASELEKIETPSSPAAPVAPTAPIETNKTPAQKPAGKPAVAQAPKLPKPGATVSLTRSEMNTVCPMCAGKQFEGDEFNGCSCFSALVKSIEILHKDDLGVIVHINEDMGTIVTLLESMGRH